MNYDKASPVKHHHRVSRILYTREIRGHLLALFLLATPYTWLCLKERTSRQHLHVDDCASLLEGGNGVFHMQDTKIVQGYHSQLVTNDRQSCCVATVSPASLGSSWGLFVLPWVALSPQHQSAPLFQPLSSQVSFFFLFFYSSELDSQITELVVLKACRHTPAPRL